MPPRVAARVGAAAGRASRAVATARPRVDVARRDARVVATRRRRFFSSSLAAARGDANAAFEETDDENPFEAFARDVRAREVPPESRRVEAALRHLSRWDADAALACAYVGGVRARETTREEVRAISRACERWSDRVSGRLRRAGASLVSEGSARARAAGARVEACARDVERLSRARVYDAIVDEERYALGETYSYSVASASTSVDERWRMACVNVGAYLELVGATPTREEWTRLRVVFDGLVAHVDGEVECERLVRDDARWREMKMTMDDSAVRGKRLTRVRNNARYEAAKRELVEAKREWSEATRAYKAARRRVKAARHDVHKTRKAVRIEYR